jgi:competence CoiA-like predicted nuclease
MYAQIRYYCPACNEHKEVRIGNKGLPEESLRFQIELKGIICPACGYQLNCIHREQYFIVEE